MFKKIFSFAILFFVSSVLYAQPKIEIIGGDTYDWGKVKLSEGPLKASVKIKNSGNQELIIQNVKPSCGCTTAPLDKDRLKPGETATLDITLKVSHGGKTTKSIRIASNDPKVPNKNLTITADVVEMLKIEPYSSITFKELQVGKESMGSVSIFNYDKMPVKVTLASIDPNYMIVNFVSPTGELLNKTAVIKPGQKIDVRVKLTPQQSGYLRTTVKLETDHPDHKVLEIRGYGNVNESPLFNTK